MTNEEAFYGLWNNMPTTFLVDFPFDQLGEEDFELAEAMVGEGLNRLMEFKTQLLNAKHKLQTPDLQWGVLPQTEEGKESVCAETDTDKTERLIKDFRSQPIKIGQKENKADCGKTKGTAFRLQGFEEGFFGAIPDLRCEDIRLSFRNNGDSPHEGSGE